MRRADPGGEATSFASAEPGHAGRDPDPLRARRTLLVGFAALAALGTLVGYASDPSAPLALHALAAVLAGAGITLMAAVAFRVVARHPDAWRDAGGGARLLADLLAVGLVVFGALAGAGWLLQPVDALPPPGLRAGPAFWQRVLLGLPEFLTTFLGFAGIAYASDYVRRSRTAELQKARLRTELTRSRLQLLRGQLHPHFLFNTLHSVSALLYDNPAAAERMLAGLRDLLRAALSDPDVQMVTLREELDFLKAYVEIEQTRLGGRLRVSWEVAAELERLPVPRLLLQPLVENAIRHGVAPRRSGGTVRVVARYEGEGAVLEVHDDGVGLPPGWAPRPGAVGLANTRARIQDHYPEGGAFALANAPGGGVVARVRVPGTPRAG